VFHLDGHSYEDLAAVRDVLLGHLADTFPSVLGAADAHMLGVAYLAKMFITPPSNSGTDDAWALFTLAPGAPGAPALDLKFVQRISRPYQFSLNSFQIVLPLSGEQSVANYLSAIGATAVAHADVEAEQKKADVAIDNADVAGTASAADDANALITAASASSATTAAAIAEEPRPPTMEAVCMYGDFEAALQHVNDRVVAVSCEGDVSLIHGGGLLKYASLLCRGYTVSPHLDRARMEAMMISRFQIDYPAARYQPGGPPPPGTMDAMSQRICHFMATHMPGQYAEQANFLLVLHDIAASCTLPEVPLVQVSFNFVRSAQHVLQQMYLAGHVLPPPTPAAAAAYANFVRRASYAHSAPAPWASHGPQRHRNNGPSAGRPQRQRGRIEQAVRRPTKRGPEPATDFRRIPSSGRAGAMEGNGAPVPPPPPPSVATVAEARSGVPLTGPAAASTSQGGSKGRRARNTHQGTLSDPGMVGHPPLASTPFAAPIPGAALPTVSYASAAASASTSASASASASTTPVGVNAAAMSAFQLQSDENPASSAQAGVAAAVPGHAARGVLIASPTDSAIGSDTSGDEGDGGHHAPRRDDGAVAVQPAVRRRFAPVTQVRHRHSSVRGGGLTEITNSVSATSPKNAVEKPVAFSPQPACNARHPVQ
jgi:hypothetical protein